MWLEETTSPSTSSIGATRTCEAPVGQQQRGVARRPVAEAEVLPHADVRRPQRADQHLVDERLGALVGPAAVERHHDELLDAERLDQLRLAIQGGQQPRRVVGQDDGTRVRIEGQHGVVAGDHLAVPEVDAVEGADGHATGARHDVGELDHLHADRKPTTGLSASPSRRSATAIGPSSSRSSTGPVVTGAEVSIDTP